MAPIYGRFRSAPQLVGGDGVGQVPSVLMTATNAPSTSLLDLTSAELAERMVADGLRPLHAITLWRLLHHELETDLLRRDELVPPLKRWLAEKLAGEFSHITPEIASEVPSADGLTQKLLLRLADGQEVETVVMGYTGRHTACISTQAGCAMGCVFCATGQMGFVRHLKPGEIVAQVLQAQRLLKSMGRPGLRNLVFMGMGEPLHNYDSVMQALKIITDPRSSRIGPSRITISTVGVVPGIIRFAEEGQPYNLAVSLHAATDAERTALVPSNARWPLAELMDACRFFNQRTGRRIFFGWTLIEGRNDSPETARQVAELLKGLDAHVNLIPLNPTEKFNGRESAESAADGFQKVLAEAGIPSTVRQRRGIDVAAGCGQLKAAKRNSRSITSPGR